MTNDLFRDRADAARRLAAELKPLDLRNPLVLGIPRGGVVTAAALARELDAEADVVLARKLRHPHQPELAIGALSEDGEVHINKDIERMGGIDEEYLEQERQERFAELKHRREMFRSIRPAAKIEGRTVIVTDDGIATGSTMLAALATVRAKRPHELILAVPVAPPSSLQRLQDYCDRVVCPLAPESFMAIGQFYENFDQVEDEQACEVLRDFAPAS